MDLDTSIVLGRGISLKYPHIDINLYEVAATVMISLLKKEIEFVNNQNKTS